MLVLKKEASAWGALHFDVSIFSPLARTDASGGLIFNAPAWPAPQTRPHPGCRHWVHPQDPEDAEERLVAHGLMAPTGLVDCV